MRFSFFYRVYTSRTLNYLSLYLSKYLSLFLYLYFSLFISCIHTFLATSLAFFPFSIFFFFLQGINLVVHVTLAAYNDSFHTCVVPH